MRTIMKFAADSMDYQTVIKNEREVVKSVLLHVAKSEINLLPTNKNVYKERLPKLLKSVHSPNLQISYVVSQPTSLRSKITTFF